MVSRICISYLTLGKILKLNSNKEDSLIKFVKDSYILSEDELNLVLIKIRSFFLCFKRKLVKHCRSYEKVFNDSWMSGKLEVEWKEKPNIKRKFKVGRPPKDFDQCADRTKRRKIEEVCATLSENQIQRAAIRNMKKPVAKVVKQVMFTDVSEANKISKKIMRDEVIPLTPLESLLFLIEAKFSKSQYIMLRELSMSRNSLLFPTYREVALAKKHCYPDPSFMEITEISVTIQLQGLLDITAKRLIESMTNEQLDFLPTNLILYSKYGGDGASNQSRYKQKFGSQDSDVCDSALYMISLVPVRLAKQTDSKSIFWENNRSGSPRYCRPIKFMFVKETEELVLAEMQRVKEQIIGLLSTTIIHNNKTFSVSHKLFPTMVDGKTCQYLSHTKSSQACPICKATPNEMNDVESVSCKVDDKSIYEFGLSPLHAKIRFMEYILNISYNLSFKKWAATKKNGFDIEKKQNKLRIQKEFRERLGIYIDVVKQGSGNTNDGNTARRFFENYNIVAEITLVDENIIKR